MIPDTDLDAWEALCTDERLAGNTYMEHLLLRLIAAYREQRKLLDWAMEQALLYHTNRATVIVYDDSNRPIGSEHWRWVVTNEASKVSSYIDSRDLLERRPEHPDWVRIKEKA